MRTTLQEEPSQRTQGYSNVTRHSKHTLITHIEPLCLAYNDTQNQSKIDFGAESVLSTANHSFESDRLCAVLEVDAVLSEDFDCVALFGARVMIVSVDHDTASYVALSDVLRTFLCNSRDELVNKCCLMGTDYNLGMKGHRAGHDTKN